MSVVEALLVVAGGMLGAPVRYLLDRWVQSWHDSGFPWGTWTVNVTGSALLGGLAAGVSTGTVPGLAFTGLGVGFCGALTTYSTFSYETVRLLETGAWRHATGNVLGSLAAGLTAAAGVGALVSVLLA